MGCNMTRESSKKVFPKRDSHIAREGWSAPIYDDSNSPRVLVAGAGAVGLTLAAALTAGGAHVELLCRHQHAEAILDGGISLHGNLGTHRVIPSGAVSLPSQLYGKHFDLLLITAKSFDTKAVALACQPAVSRNTVVVSVQNGLGNLEALVDVFGPEQPLYGSVAMFGCRVTAPGEVQVISETCEVRLGGYGNWMGDASPAALRMLEQLKQFGVRTAFVEDIRKDLWAKYLMNATTNALAAIENKTLGELFENERNVLTMRQLVDEIFAVARAAGIALPWQTPEAFDDAYRRDVLPRFAPHRPSTASDLAQGKRTEWQALNGYVVEMGRKLHVATPVNAYMTKLLLIHEELSQHLVSVERKLLQNSLNMRHGASVAIA